MIVQLVAAAFLTAIAYLIFPISYKSVKGKVPNKKGSIISLVNSIVCAIIFMLLSIVLNIDPKTNGAMFAPAILYYFINRSILVDYNMSEEQYAKKLEPEGSDNDDTIIEIDNEDSNAFKIKHKSKIGAIKNLQLAFVIVFFCLLAFVILYPTSMSIIKSQMLPSTNQYRETKYTELYAEDKVYCKTQDDCYYVYIKNNGTITLYKFINRQMNGVVSGYATGYELKKHFGNNLYSGYPPITFVFPEMLPILLSSCGVALIVLAIFIMLIHKYAKEELFYVQKTNKQLKKLKSAYDTKKINKSDFVRCYREYFSKEIIENNKFFDVFKFLY